MTKTKYRSTNKIIQTILEGLLRSQTDKSSHTNGIVKSNLIKYCGLKTAIAEKYLTKMKRAGYIESHIDYWGEREITIYEITPKGIDRYQWFVTITAELEEST